MKQRVADHIGDYFEARDVDYYFGYIGGSLWPLLDGLTEFEAQGIQAKHEGQAVHMADGYYRVSKKTAPVLVTKGPGALNAVSAVSNLMSDSTSTVVVIGGVPTQHSDKGAFESLYYHKQEGIVDLYREVTKRTWNSYRPDTTLELLDRAFKESNEGRPGPTAVLLPYDVQLEDIDIDVPDPDTSRADTKPKPSTDSLNDAVELLTEADKPVIVAGGGVNLANGVGELRSLIEDHQIPVVTSHGARGVVPEDHELSLGPYGRAGWECANQAVGDADVVVGIGTRFADWETAGWHNGAVYNIPPTKVVQVDIDPTEIGRNMPVEVGIMSDARSFIVELNSALSDSGASNVSSDEWLDTVHEWKANWRQFVSDNTAQEGSPIHPHRLVHDTSEAMADDDMLWIDCGDVIQYAEAFTTVKATDSYFFNSSMMQMGWAMGAALGGKLADPDREAVVLVGDGAFSQCPYVISTAVEYDIPITWVVANNYGPNIERKAQQNMFGRVHPWTSFTADGEGYSPDFVGWSKAAGGDGVRVEKNEDVYDAVSQGLESDKPFVVEAIVDKDVPSWFAPGIERDYPDSWTYQADYL